MGDITERTVRSDGCPKQALVPTIDHAIAVTTEHLDMLSGRMARMETAGRLIKLKHARQRAVIEETTRVKG